MNCPSRTDEPPRDAGWNQNPPRLSADLTTRQDLNGMVNLRTEQDSSKEADDTRTQGESDAAIDGKKAVEDSPRPPLYHRRTKSKSGFGKDSSSWAIAPNEPPTPVKWRPLPHWRRRAAELGGELWRVLAKFGKFIGPGFIISVAYIDPGNYSTDVAAGAATRFELLFIVLMSNVFAIVLQSLAVRLGAVTGLNLAEHCRAHLPRWLNLVLYLLGEAAIIATDIAEVIGSAIALNLLLKIPLVAGCAITLVDVLIILIFYSPAGSMRRLRAFEYFVMALVLGVVICFCIQLSLISSSVSVRTVFAGYLPSSAVVKGQGIYLSCGILGATVMPHSLYLGSGMVQSRLREFDNTQPPPPPNHALSTLHNRTNTVNLLAPSKAPKIPAANYRPSLAAIHHCLTYSITEVALSLFTFALFVNSAILIIAGASLYSPNDPADTNSLFSIHDLLSKTLAPAAGTIFAVALLLSGTSAGIVCTIAGQMLSEGALNWTIKPWMRRLLTRSISITPSIIIAGAVGKQGLNAALNGTQVALSVVLPFISAPLIYFTCRNKYMIAGGRDPTHPRGSHRSNTVRAGRNNTVPSQTSGARNGNTTLVDEPNASPNANPAGTPATRASSNDSMNQEFNRDLALEFDTHPAEAPVKMRNHLWVSVLAVVIWLVIVIMNMALLVLLGLGRA